MKYLILLIMSFTGIFSHANLCKDLLSRQVSALNEVASISKLDQLRSNLTASNEARDAIETLMDETKLFSKLGFTAFESAFHSVFGTEPEIVGILSRDRDASENFRAVGRYLDMLQTLTEQGRAIPQGMSEKILMLNQLWLQNILKIFAIEVDGSLGEMSSERRHEVMDAYNMKTVDEFLQTRRGLARAMTSMPQLLQAGFYYFLPRKAKALQMQYRWKRWKVPQILGASTVGLAAGVTGWLSLGSVIDPLSGRAVYDMYNLLQGAGFSTVGLAATAFLPWARSAFKIASFDRKVQKQAASIVRDIESQFLNGRSIFSIEGVQVDQKFLEILESLDLGSEYDKHMNQIDRTSLGQMSGVVTRVAALPGQINLPVASHIANRANEVSKVVTETADFLKEISSSGSSVTTSELSSKVEGLMAKLDVVEREYSLLQKITDAVISKNQEAYSVLAKRAKSEFGLDDSMTAKEVFRSFRDDAAKLNDLRSDFDRAADLVSVNSLIASQQLAAVELHRSQLGQIRDIVGQILKVYQLTTIAQTVKAERLDSLRAVLVDFLEAQ